MIEIINSVIVLFTLICGYFALKTKNLISSIFLIGAFGFFLAILWAVLSAPDVSFTEGVVGAGASTIFFLLALLGSSHTVKEDNFVKTQTLPLLCILGLGVLFLWASTDLPELGSLVSAASQYLSPHYLTHAYHDSHTPNVVTAVVVDYRSFDTLVEAAVVFTAGVACLLIFREEEKE